MVEYSTQNPDIAKLLAGATEAGRQGRSGEARQLLQRVLALDPTNPAALNSLGMQALGQGAAAEAADYFRRATAADGTAPALWMNLASAQRAQGDDEGERSSLQRALLIDQRHFMALVRLAELHERLGEEGPALQRWDAVIACGNMMPTDAPPAVQQIITRARMFVAGSSQRFAAEVDEGLSGVREKVSAGERRRFDACIDVVLRRRSIYLNECQGVHYPFLPADEFFERERFPWLPEIEAKTQEIRTEFEALLAADPDHFQPYVEMEPGTPDSKWTPLDRSLDWSAVHLWRHGKRIEEICQRCPITAAALETLPRAEVQRRMPTAFFSVLKPRTRIPPHTGVSNVRAIIHLPLIVPEGCGFRVGAETREWREGQALAFDDTIEHEAWNNSDQPRAVLIFDVWNPHLSETERDLLKAFYATVDSSSHDPGFSTAMGEA